MRSLVLNDPSPSPSVAIRTEHVLVTGFEPFGGYEDNPSIAAAYAATMSLMRRVTTAFQVQPVTYRAAVALQDHVCLGGVHLHFGLAADADAVRIEQFAHNCAGQSPDNAGSVPHERPFDCPSDAYQTAFDCAALVRELQARNIKARISRDCGGYVCNATYFASLHRAAVPNERGDHLSAALFVHIPMSDAEGARRVGAAVAESLLAQLAIG